MLINVCFMLVNTCPTQFNIFVLGASIFLIGLHAVFYKRLDESDAFDLEMDDVTVS